MSLLLYNRYATDGMLTYVRDYADRFENTKKLYRENNLTLELLSERVRLEALKVNVKMSQGRYLFQCCTMILCKKQ